MQATKYIVVFLTILMTSIGSLSALTPSDSIRQIMKGLSGSDLLEAHSNLCRLAGAEDDPQNELGCIHAYLDEAIRQRDVQAEGHARLNLLYCYYNYNMTDSLVTTLPRHLSALKKNDMWEYYYSAWCLLVERYLYEGKLHTALKEAEKIYVNARETQNNYGLGVSAYTMGSIYQTMGRFKEAEASLTESVSTLSKEDGITELLSAYNALCETLDAMHQYDKLKAIAADWKASLDKYREHTLDEDDLPILNGRYLYWALAAAIGEIGTGDYDKAEELLLLAESYAEGRKVIVRCKLLQVRSRYHAAKGEFAQALRANEESVEIISDLKDPISLLTLQTEQADILTEMERYKEAAELYKSIFHRREELRNAQFASQLDELRTLFEVDTLKLQNEISRTLFYFSLAIGGLLLLALILYVRYTHRLRHKNRVLYDAIQQSQKAKEELDTSVHLIPEEELDGKERLYRQLCTLMDDQKLFTEPHLNREILAEHLGSNHVYLAEAIRKYAGDITVGEFINGYRLRHAAYLLTHELDLNIGEVEYMSGFNSRTTFSRLFRERYGMSPSEYRDVSKEKKSQKLTSADM